MKKLEIYVLECLLFISMIVFNRVIPNPYLLNLSIILISIYFIVRFGIMKDNNYTQKIAIRMVISCILVYLITIYLIGILTGFHESIVSWNRDYIVRILGLGSIVILFEEVVRYIICRNTPHQKAPIIVYSAILAILNIILEINGYDLSDHESLFVFLTTVVLPAISREAICSYLTYKISYKPSMIVKLSLYLYELVLPIIPDLGNYLYAVANLALPYAIYFCTSKLNHYKDKQLEYQKQTIRRLFYVPTMVVLGILVILVSGISSHTMIAIGSNSMNPSYSRGDAVIYQKTSPDKIQVGEVIAFYKEGRIVTHRVIQIAKMDHSIKFQTKGDANNTPDAFQVEEKEVLGIVKYTIKYVGYPTLWLNDTLKGKENNE